MPKTSRHITEFTYLTLRPGQAARLGLIQLSSPGPGKQSRFDPGKQPASASRKPASAAASPSRNWFRYKHNTIVINCYKNPIILCYNQLNRTRGEKKMLEEKSCGAVVFTLINGQRHYCLLYTSPSPRDRG